MKNLFFFLNLFFISLNLQAQVKDTVTVYNGIIKYKTIIDSSTVLNQAQIDSIPADSVVYIYANTPEK